MLPDKQWAVHYRKPTEDGSIQLGVLVPSKLDQKTLDEVCEYVNGFVQQAPVVMELMPLREVEEFRGYE